MKTLTTIFSFGCAAMISITINAQELTGLDIMKKNDQQVRSKSEQVEINMELVNNKGNKRIRVIKELSMVDKSNNRSVLIRFESPADVKGTSFLSIENTGRDNDQWLYLPALKKNRRISASDESDSFMGSDFAYEDISTEDLDENTYTLKETDQSRYIVEAIPSSEKKIKNSGYSKRIIYVNKTNFIISQIEFFNKRGEKIKEFIGDDIKIVSGTEKYRTYRMSMKNIVTGHTTVLTFKNFVIDKDLDKNAFTIRNLEG